MLPINPPSERLGQENAPLSGRGTRYHVPDFEGCLSIKSVVSGTAVRKTENRRLVLNEDSCLVLNDRQPYKITIDSASPATTFCLFFERGFVEDLHRARVTPSHVLLDSPEPARSANIEFFTRIKAEDRRLIESVRRFHGELRAGWMSRIEWDQSFLSVGEMLVLGRRETMREIEGLPALRGSTRRELYARLLKGRDFLLSSFSERILLKDMATAACLSPFHFHRTFTRVFGETPHRYLTRYRLHRAARLLRYTDLSVTEICLNTGFESVASFSGLFRAYYGSPPSKFSKIREAEEMTIWNYRI